MRALIIEDDLFSQEVAKRALQRLGVSDITLAENGATGLQSLDRLTSKPDLIICDIFMPEMDGIEIVNALAQRQFAGGLVLVTGSDMQYLDIAKTLAVKQGLQFLGWISKPLTDDALEHALLQLKPAQ